MEKVAAGRDRRQVGRWGVLVLAAWAVGPTWGQDAAPPPAEVLLAQARTEQPPLRVRVDASALPRLDAPDAGFQAPRVDVSLFPARAGGMGAVVGVSGFSGQQPAPGLAPQRSNVDVGLRFSHRLASQNRIDVTAWRRMTGPDDAYSLIQAQAPVYGARVEMNLKSARPAVLGFDRGLLGFQLESGARISIKRKDGRPMVYYRTTF